MPRGLGLVQIRPGEDSPRVELPDRRGVGEVDLCAEDEAGERLLPRLLEDVAIDEVGSDEAASDRVVPDPVAPIRAQAVLEHEAV